MIIKCHDCSKELNIKDKVGFRELCPHCSANLHSCVQCRLWDTRSEQCTEPQAEKERDPEAGNFCDYFIAREADSSEPEDSDRGEAEAMWRKLTDKS